ncbi:sigma 54-interacting transcriptional regulator [Desulfobulbus rhabdoformis]|uniref:sigma-54 interaction domain-containing protein n=1 Tax=Desulfobulbus rhabdoformis TaxID=34032 RepID=UPI0019633EFD|nr:sigma 54-interacting transcriptional regulator [Desulfobulbus rhabdoformis]MBM9614852.1 sigma 54-interacting transcriptional regulator [Desulfobulbus rhabdoformis]
MKHASFLKNQTIMVELLNAIPHGIALLDANLCIAGMNRFLEAMLGYTTEEVRGVYGDFILRTSLGSNDQVVRTVMETGQSVSQDSTLINKARKKIPVGCTISRLEDATGARAVLIVLEDMSALQEARAACKHADAAGDILGHSPQMKEVFAMMSVLAKTDASVLITGETGTGKDKIAEQLHTLSSRGRQPFIKVNCGALPEALLESELFGHVKGAFTGAVKEHKGMFRLADKGTIFLTEIGDLSLPLQVKLLSVLDDHEFYPVGSSKKVSVDVRVIAATHKPLRAEVRRGTFREDLFYRLNVLHLHVPPLREREGDVRLLLDHFLQFFAQRLGKNMAGFTPKALEPLVHFSYPGNVRELRNIVEYAVNMSRGERVTFKDLPPYALQPVGADFDESEEDKTTLGSDTAPPLQHEKPLAGWAQVERDRLLDALSKTGGNRSEAAALLGCGRTTLWRKMKKYDLA